MSETIPPFCRGFHVLLVDYDMFNLVKMKQVLETNNYKVTPENSGVDAVSMIADQNGCPYHIVIAEIAMPDMDGFKLLDQIRVRCSKNIPVIILMTANVEPGMPEKAINLGATRFFQKPIPEPELIAVWQYVVSRNFEASQPNVQIGRNPTVPNSYVLKPSTGTQAATVVNIYGNQWTTDTSDKEHSTRMVWTLDLQRKFSAAYSKLGELRAKPQELLKAMNDPNLTLRQIGNHLQKCRVKARKSGIPLSDLMSQYKVPNLSNGTGQGDTDNMNSWESAKQLVQAQWRNLYLNNMANRNTYQLGMARHGFLDLGGPSSASANMTNSLSQNQILINDLQLRLSGLQTSSVNMGGLNACNVGNVGYNFSNGQGQLLGISPYLSRSTGALSNNNQSQNLPYLLNTGGFNNVESQLSPCEFSNTGALNNVQSQISPCLLSNTGGFNNVESQLSPCEFSNTEDLNNVQSQISPCLLCNTGGFNDVQSQISPCVFSSTGPLNNEQSQLSDSQEPQEQEELYIDWEAMEQFLNIEPSQEDSQKSEEEFGMDWEALAPDADMMEAGVIDESGPFVPKPRGMGPWCLDDLTVLLGEDAKFGG